MTKQRGKSDCVIASLANLVDRSYAEIKRKFGKIDRGGLLPHEQDWIMGCFGDWKKLRVRKKQTAAEWAAGHPHGRALLILDAHSIFTGKVHAVAIIDGKVIDPDVPSDPSTQAVVRAHVLIARYDTPK